MLFSVTRMPSMRGSLEVSTAVEPALAGCCSALLIWMPHLTETSAPLVLITAYLKRLCDTEVSVRTVCNNHLQQVFCLLCMKQEYGDTEAHMFVY